MHSETAVVSVCGCSAALLTVLVVFVAQIRGSNKAVPVVNAVGTRAAVEHVGASRHVGLPARVGTVPRGTCGDAGVTHSVSRVACAVSRTMHSSPAASLPRCACSHAPSRLRFAAACARGEADFSPRTPWRQGRRLQCASSLPICDRYSRMDARLRHALQHRMQTHSGLHGTAQALTRLYHERGRRAGARLERAQQQSKARIAAAKAALARVREECAKVEEDAREHTRKMHVHQRRVSAAASTLD